MGLKKKKLLLINPANQKRRGLGMRKLSTYPPLSLAIIASLTPDHWEVKIIDENFDAFEFEEADLVGFTSFTSTAPRAYELASIFREHDISTVMGGIHASMLPGEAALFIDAVVVGEAESVWGQLLHDFENNALKKIYKGELLELGGQPIPRHDLLSKKYLFSAIQTTRGCPMQCDFCSVSTFNGCQYRVRPIPEILDELETLPTKLVFFYDDNIIGYGTKSQERAIALFKGIVERRIRIEWLGQASINFADNTEVLKWAARSGCRMVLIGIESEKTDQLKEAGKKMNLHMGVDAYAGVFRKIHRYGISILGAFIFGMDSDSVHSLRERADYILKSSVDAWQTTILTPLPGTGLYERLKSENRILHTNYPEDWSRYDFTEPLILPKLMSNSELSDTMREVWTRIYNRKTVRKQLRRSVWNLRNFKHAMWGYVTNYNNYCMNFEEKISSEDPRYAHWLVSEKAAYKP
ncbi:MAG: radical SAM protein [Bacteroidota bacterium]